MSLPGTTANLDASFEDVDGDPVDPDTAPTLDLIAPDATTFAAGLALAHLGLGSYRYAWAIPGSAAVGVWTLRWHATINGENVDEDESFVVGSIVHDAPAESVVCQLWAQPADLGNGPWTTDEMVAALVIASDTLYAFSGRQFPGLCTDVVRPCGGHAGYDAPPATIAGFARTGYQGAWLGCRCGCEGYSRVRLGAEPVVSITEVLVDGEVVDPGLYQVDERRYLAAVPDVSTNVFTAWPCSQDIDLPSTEPGTFEVTYVFGRPIPAGAKAAAVALATQILKAGDNDCQLPANTAQLIRQQTNITLMDPQVLFDKGSVGIRAVDRWIASVNPHHTNEPGRVLSPDQPRPSVHVDT